MRARKLSSVESKARAKPVADLDPRYAHVDTVEELVETLPETMLLCRELGHQWRPWAAQRNDDQRSYDRTLRCPRCLTRRHQVLTLTGTIVRNSYEYPDGYQTRGLGRLAGSDRDVLRLASLTRTISKQESKGNGERAAG